MHVLLMSDVTKLKILCTPKLDHDYHGIWPDIEKDFSSRIDNFYLLNLGLLCEKKWVIFLWPRLAQK